MIAFVLRETGRDPAWLIGAPVPQLGEQRRRGGGLARRRGRRVRPLGRSALPAEIAVVTNVELDHHTEFASLAELEARVRRRGRRAPRRSSATRRRSTASSPLPGELNRRNAGTALAALEAAGVPRAEAEPVLARFTGTGRRFEVSEAGGVTIVDDYGHHPSELAATIAAVREAYPGRRLRVLFQPHLYSRTRHLAARARRGARGGRRRGGDRRLPRARGSRSTGVTGKLVVDALSDRGVLAAWMPTVEQGVAYLARGRSRATCCSRSAPATSTARRRCSASASANGTASRSRGRHSPRAVELEQRRLRRARGDRQRAGERARDRVEHVRRRRSRPSRAGSRRRTCRRRAGAPGTPRREPAVIARNGSSGSGRRQSTRRFSGKRIAAASAKSNGSNRTDDLAHVGEPPLVEPRRVRERIQQRHVDAHAVRALLGVPAPVLAEQRLGLGDEDDDRGLAHRGLRPRAEGRRLDLGRRMPAPVGELLPARLAHDRAELDALARVEPDRRRVEVEADRRAFRKKRRDAARELPCVGARHARA